MKDFQIEIPGSKSITNRVLLLAALAEGQTVLRNVLSSDDADHMKTALQKLGVGIVGDDAELTINGLGGKFQKPKEMDNELFLGNAGTATRFLTAALATQDFEVTITGNQRMQQRPIADLLGALRQLGVECDDLKGTDCPPVKIKGPMIGGNVHMMGDASSQYFSALLMAAPFAKEDVVITVTGDLVSKPYIDITIECMKAFGVEVVNENYQWFRVKAGQSYQSCEYEIEGDASGATYFLGLGALHGVKAEITNVPLDAIQGDVAFLDVLAQMGIEIGGGTKGANGGGSIWARGNLMVNGFPELKSLGEIDLNHIPDAAMTVAVLAALAEGETKIVNVANLRIKECDRITALVTELKKLRVEAEELDDGLRIIGDPKALMPRFNGDSGLETVEIKTYDDHRMAMCFGILATILKGIKILDPGCVAKTYPGFWGDLQKSGIRIDFV